MRHFVLVLGQKVGKEEAKRAGTLLDAVLKTRQTPVGK